MTIFISNHTSMHVFSCHVYFLLLPVGIARELSGTHRADLIEVSPWFWWF